ncbi:MAG: GHKL domain-containing protein [Deltaproteobacteria bacterium]|nr:MAG: GHKL domain-containing protein [Deltaproteobacteria bacterium]
MEPIASDPLGPWRVVSFAVAAGASLALALLALPMAMATRKLRIWGILVGIGALAFAYLMGTVGMLTTTAPDRAVRWAAVSLLPTPGIVWGLWYLTTHVPRRGPRSVPASVHGSVLAVMFLLTVAAASDALLGTHWVVADVEFLPGTLRHRVVVPGPVGYVFFVASLLVLYAGAALLVTARRDAATPSLVPLVVGTSAYFATLTNDLLLVLGAYDGPFLNQIGFVGMYAGFCAYFGHIFVENAERLRQAHDELKRHRRAAVHASRLRSMATLAAFVTHELGNDLQVVENVSLSLIHHDGSGVPDEDLGDLRLATRHMASVLRGLRRLSRDTTEADPKESHALSELVEDAARLVGPLSRKHRVSLRVLPPHRSDDLVEVRAPEIMQVVINLLKNAIDAVRDRDDPMVRVRFDVRDAAVALRVEDNGPGVPEHLRERIFEPFFTSKSMDEGTGIGLAVVREIVRDHGGTVEIRRVDGWTVFEVVIPRATAPMADASAGFTDRAS